MAKQGLPKVASKSGETTAIEDVSFEVPIFQDMYGQTPLDYCLGVFKRYKNKLRRQVDDKPGFSRGPETEAAVRSWQNYNLAACLFDNIKGYSFLHSGSALVDAITDGFHNDLPGLVEYLDSRFKQGKLKSQNRKELRKGVLIGKGKEHEYGVMELTACTDKAEIKNRMFQEDGALIPMELQYFDLPLLHTGGREGQAFINALDAATDMEVFGNKSIQRLITYRWKRWKVYYYTEIVVPYLVLMALYEYASHRLASFAQSRTQVLVVLGTVFALSVYFLILEIILLARNPRKHLSQLTSLF